MKATFWFYLLSAAGMISVTVLSFAVFAAAPSSSEAARRQMKEAFQQGNYKDAYEGFRKLALDPDDDRARWATTWTWPSQCLQRLNRVDEIDAFREAVDQGPHRTTGGCSGRAAENYMNIPHHGFIVAGKFYRGNNGAAAQVVNAAERDRVRALQLMVQAMPLAMQDDNHAEVGDFLLDRWPACC